MNRVGEILRKGRMVRVQLFLPLSSVFNMGGVGGDSKKRRHDEGSAMAFMVFRLLYGWSGARFLEKEAW